jgi:hypothetical protein
MTEFRRRLRLHQARWREANGHPIGSQPHRPKPADTPGSVREVRFAHSPGRLDPEWLNSLRAFDAAFVTDLDDGSHEIVGADVKYHEWAKPAIPKPENMWRYLEVADRSGAFKPGGTEQVRGRSARCEMWLEHLLQLSMLQHPGGEWSWGQYVVVYPAGNVDYADAVDRYRRLLADDSTFGSMTLEALLDAGVLPTGTSEAIRDRYLPG